MADRKISELTNITGANLADTDEFVVVDTSASETKAITYGELKKFTGTVTADGLTVGGNILRDVDTSSVVISGGNAAATGANAIFYGSTSGNVNDILLRRNNVRFAAFDGATGDISFYEDTGTTPKFFWDASAESLTVNSTVKVEGGTTNGFLQASGTSFQLGASTASNLIAYTNNAERMRIDSSGNVGIGTSSPNGVTEISSSATGDVLALQISNSAGADSDSVSLRFRNSTSATSASGGSEITGLRDAALNGGSLLLKTASSVGTMTERMRIDSSGNVGIGTSSPDSSSRLHVEGGAAEQVQIRVSQSDNTGVHLFSQSSSAGVWNQDNTSMLFATNDTERMRIDSSGNVGIGVVPSAWRSATDAIQFGQSASISSNNNANAVSFTSNAYINSSNANIRISTGKATQYYQFDGEHVWQTSGSDAAGTTVSYTEVMRIDASGNLLVGTTDSTPENNSTASSASNGFVVDSNGKIKVGQYGGSCAILNRVTTDGTIVDLRKDGAPVGSIGTQGSKAFIGTGDAGFLFDNTNNRIDPCWPTNTGSTTNGTLDLGGAATRFKDLYLSGGVYLGGTGAANKLDDYEEGTWTPVAAGESSSGTASYSIQAGTYTKIGNMVYIMGRLGWTGHTGSGNLIVNGLPFSSNNQYAFLGFSFRDLLTITAGKTAYVYVKPSSATAAFIEIGTGTSATSGVSMDTAVTDVSFSGFYRVS